MSGTIEKIRWGVLGTGKIIGKAGPGIQQTSNGEWLGVAGRNGETGAAAAELYGVPRSYASYADLIEDPDIDAVYIALLNHLHYEWALRAIEAGKHVLLEKPFTLHVGQALELQSAAAAKGVLLEEAFVWRYYEAFPEARRRIEEGAIGKPGMFYGHFSFVAFDDSTRWVKEWGGGAMWDVGCYPVAWSRYLLGAEPESAECSIEWDEARGVDKRVTGTLHYAEGATAHICASFDMRGGAYCEIVGSEGKLRIDNIGSASELTSVLTVNGEKSSWTTDRITPFRKQMEAFADCIQRRISPRYGADDAVSNMRAIDALFEAARQGAKVPVRG